MTDHVDPAQRLAAFVQMLREAAVAREHYAAMLLLPPPRGQGGAQKEFAIRSIKEDDGHEGVRLVDLRADPMDAPPMTIGEVIEQLALLAAVDPARSVFLAAPYLPLPGMPGITYRVDAPLEGMLFDPDGERFAFTAAYRPGLWGRIRNGFRALLTRFGLVSDAH